MKIKKLLIGLLVSGLAFSFTGCGDKEINDNGEKVQSFVNLLKLRKYKSYQVMGLVDIVNILYMIKPLKLYM